jgi:hypothetical protein
MTAAPRGPALPLPLDLVRALFNNLSLAPGGERSCDLVEQGLDP